MEILWGLQGITTAAPETVKFYRSIGILRIEIMLIRSDLPVDSFPGGNLGKDGLHSQG